MLLDGFVESRVVKNRLLPFLCNCIEIFLFESGPSMLATHVLSIFIFIFYAILSILSFSAVCTHFLCLGFERNVLPGIFSTIFFLGKLL
jgi:hypothetical protein